MQVQRRRLSRRSILTAALVSATISLAGGTGGFAPGRADAAQWPASATTPESQPSTPETRPSTPETRPSTPETRPSTPGTQPSTPETKPSTPGTQPSSPSDSLSPHPNDRFFLGTRTFKIPFTVGSHGRRPAEVQLFVRKGPQDQWQMAASKRPEPQSPHFEYTTDIDGELWFATRTIDAANQAAQSEDILKIVVDTVKPVIQVTADADGDGRVTGTLHIQDASPLKNIEIAYATDTLPQWRPLTLPPDRSGRIEFVPTGEWGQVVIRAAVTDSAGNYSTGQRWVRRPRIATTTRNRYAINSGSAGSNGLGSNGLGSNGLDADGSGLPSRRATPHADAVVDAVPQAPGRVGAIAVSNRRQYQLQTEPPAASTPGQANPADAFTSASTALPPPATPDQISDGFETLNAPAGAPETIATPRGEPIDRPERTLEEAFKPIDEPSALPPGDEEVPSSSASSANRSDQSPGDRGEPIDLPAAGSMIDRVPVRYADGKRFSLEYELEAVGRRGVEAIELYGTLNQGRSWKLWGRDPDRVSPFDIEVREQGVFGYRIVVVGNNGLASPRPQAGEEPDILVVVDTQSPTVSITGARYGEGDEIGALVIDFECEDANLTARPITISISETEDGPWTTIVTGLTNDGRYVWPADPQLPRSFHLRIDGEDMAGNTGSYVLDRPIDAQGLAPRARIRGFQPQ